MISASASIPAISVSVSICAVQTIGSIMVKNYISTASDTQTFADFAGIANITVIVQGGGLMGHLSGLDASHKLRHNWDSATTIATFKTALPAGLQLLVIESSN